MTHRASPPRPTVAEPRTNHRLYVEFSDGVKGEIDLSGRLFGPVFEPLRDPEIFRQVTIDEFGAFSWACGADLAPDAIHERLSSAIDAKPLKTG